MRSLGRTTLQLRCFCALPLTLSVAGMTAADGPDLIVGDLVSVTHFGSVNGVHAHSFGSVACNVDASSAVSWVADTNEHPVFAQNLYRYADGRFEQIGLSWVKHSFFALPQNLCGGACNGQGGDALGPLCSSTNSPTTNGYQPLLGPRFEVNPVTGAFPFPFSDPNGPSGDVIFKRVQVPESDLEVEGARYFIEGQFIAPDDALAGNGLNNASHREVLVSLTSGLNPIGAVQREEPALFAWADIDPGVTLRTVDLVEAGLTSRYHVGVGVTEIEPGLWAYEYAIHNLNSARAAGSVTIPVGEAVVSDVGFHDVAYHSGEPFSDDDWTTSQDDGLLNWATEAHETDPFANAIRWGTLYNFRFVADQPPMDGMIEVGLFAPGEPGEPDTFAVEVPVPSPGALGCAADVNDDGVLDSNDFFDFISRFLAGDADFNGDGSTDSGDFFAFLNAFLEGCD